MNIDDRLDRLEIVVERIAERHEGLSQSVELLVATHRDHESDFQEHKRIMAGVIESLHQNDLKLTAMLEGQQQILAAVSQEQQLARGDRNEFRDAMMRLSVIAEAHQDTLDDHEKRFGGRGK